MKKTIIILVASIAAIAIAGAVTKCMFCNGTGWQGNYKCSYCHGTGGV